MAKLRNKLEAVLEHIINENTDKAASLLHDIVVEKAKGFYQELSEKDYDIGNERDRRVGGRPDEDYVDDIESDMTEIEADEIYDERQISEAKLLKRFDSGNYTVHLMQEGNTYTLAVTKKGSGVILDEKKYKERAAAIGTMKSIHEGKVKVNDVFSITEARIPKGKKIKEAGKYYGGKDTFSHDGDEMDFGDDHYDEGVYDDDDYAVDKEVYAGKNTYEQDDEDFDTDMDVDDADMDMDTNSDDMDMDDEGIEDRVADLESELEMLRSEFEEIVGKEIGDDEDVDDYEEEPEGDEGVEDEEGTGEEDFDLDEDFELEVIEDMEEGFYPEKAEKHITRDTKDDNVKSLQTHAPRENRGAKPFDIGVGSDGEGRPAPKADDNTPSNNADYKVKDQKNLDKNKDETDKNANPIISGRMNKGR